MLEELQNIPDFILSAARIVLILASTLIVIKAGNRFIRRSVEVLIKAKALTEEISKKRINTLTRAFSSFFVAIIWAIAVIIILSELGVNIAPLIASIGVAGLALGMGAKEMIQDYLKGMFILFEDQYRIGEEVEIGGKKGTVKDLDLRKTILEDEEKSYIIVPNGEVKTVVNFSRIKKQ